MRLRELDRLVQRLAFGDQVLRKAGALAVFGVVDAAGHHHVRHAGSADQLRDAHRAAAADEDAARAFGQRIEGGAVGHADVAGARELEAAADHRAVQRRDHRHRAELHHFERGMPQPRVMEALAGVALLQFREVEAGAEVRALAVDHRGAHAGGQVLEAVAQGQDQRVRQRIALIGACQADDGDVIADFEVQVGGLGHGCAPEHDRLWLWKITNSSCTSPPGIGIYPHWRHLPWTIAT